MSVFTRRYSGDGNHAPKEPYVLNEDSPQAQGLKAWYPMQEGASLSILRDLSGNNNHGAMSGFASADWTRGPYGAPTLSPNGADTNIDISNVTTGTNHAITFWGGWDGSADQRLLDSETGRVIVRQEKSGGDLLAYYDGSFRNSTIAGTGVWDFFAVMARDGDLTFVINDLIENFGAINALSIGGTTRLASHNVGTVNERTAPFRDARIYDPAPPDAVVQAIYSPDTRHDLYYELGRRTYFFAPAVAASIMSGNLEGGFRGMTGGMQ